MNTLLPRFTSEQVLVLIILLIIIFLILRELNTWYWKINARLATQKDTAEVLKQVLKEMQFITDYIKKRDASSIETETTQTQSTDITK